MRSMVMRLTEKETLAYLKEEGYDISSRQFYRIKKKIADCRLERLSEIAKGFVDHHLERMDTLDLVNYEMWRKYRQGDYKAMDALSKIAETQTILSAYYDASKLVMEDEISRTNKTKDEKEFQEWKHAYPKHNFEPCDLGFPMKTEQQKAEFRKKWGLDKINNKKNK